MSEEKLEQLETIVDEHSQDIRGINAVLNDITQTMQAFAQGITELRTSQQSVIETQRSILESVDRLNHTVERLATEAAEERRIWQAEIRQIWEYLLSQRSNGSNG